MKRKRVVALILSGVICGACAVGAYASFVDSIAIDSSIKMGAVNIDLKEYQKDKSSGKLVDYVNGTQEEPKIVVPAEQISKIPTVTNKGEDCYLRASFTYSGATEELTALSDEDLSGITEDWEKIGDYWYYKNVLKKGDSVDIFQGISVPADWTEAHADQELKVNVKAEAIQAKNFKPDYSAMSPWGNQTIELALTEDDGEVTEVQKNVKLSVEFNGDAHKLVAAPKNFFQNFGTMMPGDTFSDSVKLANTTDKEAELFFRTDLKNQTAEQIDLLSKINLMVNYGGKEVYNGPLKADDLNTYISLGKYKAGQEGKLDFTVSVPKELNNTYALQKADVRWIFTVKEQEDAKKKDKDSNTGGNDSGSSSGGGSEASSTTGGGSSTSAPVKTGDDTNVYPLLLAIGVSALGVVTVIVTKKKGKDEE